MTYATQKSIQEINRLVQAGYDQLPNRGRRAEHYSAACDHWLAAWALVKQLSGPTIRTFDDFDAAYPALEVPVGNWLGDLEMHLHNAGLDDPRYFEERIRFAHEQLTYFPDVDDNTYLNLRRAEGEALWLLDRQSEAEAVYQALVEKLPDHAWAYIGWADQYMWGADRTPDYPRAEAILRQAMERPLLDERGSVVERFFDLYEAWGQPGKLLPLLKEYKARTTTRHKELLAEKTRLDKQFSLLTMQPENRKASLGRNDPCWCGSGKKYKHFVTLHQTNVRELTGSGP